MLLFGRFFLNRPLTFKIMNWKILNKLECSFVPSQKCGTIMNTSGSSGYGAAMPIIGDMLGAWSTSYTNDTNERIARKNREWQSAENEKQRQWEYDRWLEEQEYNTPVNQMERYRQAGINPFLMSNNGNVGSGQTSAPSAPAPVSAPSMPSIAPYEFSGMKSFGAYLQNQQMVDASTFNQQADAFNKFVDAAMKAYSDGKSELGDKILDTGFAQLGHFNKDTSFAKETARLEIVKRNLANQYQEIVNDIESSVGKDKARAVLRKLQVEYDNIVEHTKLYKTLEDLNKANQRLAVARTDRERSEVQTNIARCKALLSDAALKFSQSEYFSELGLTQSITNRYFDSMTKNKALLLGMEYEEANAAFIGNEGVRKLQKTGLYQGQNVFNMQMEQNPILRTLDQVTDIILPFKLKKPDLPAKYRRYGHMPNGDKLVKEWYE